jgi:vancomycin resistance protein YoaR
MQFKTLLEKKRVIILLPLTLLISVFLCYTIILLSSHTFYKGIYVEDLDLYGLNQNQAKNLLVKKLETSLNDGKVNLNYKNDSMQLDLNDISFNFLVDETIKQAYAMGRSGSLFKRLNDIIKLRMHTEHLKTDYTYDQEMLKNIINDFKLKIDKDEKNAEILYNNGNIAIKNEEIGRNVDIDKTVKLIENHIDNRNIKNVNVYVNEIIPKVVGKDINEIKNILSSFATTFNLNDENRCYNIKLASGKLNNTILYPGEMFSMNKTLGPRTSENGYLEAPVIFKNELVPGAGGGVCQVTTTLYDAVLKSKLEIVERTHHSIPLGYVGPSQDATIAEDYIDFKFQNNRDYPICINAEVKSNKLNIVILGRKQADDENIVKLKSEIVEEYNPKDEDYLIDDSLRDNEKIIVRQPIKGYKSILYRETYKKSGEKISSEKISEDVYSPVKPQYRVNSNYLKILNSSLEQ